MKIKKIRNLTQVVLYGILILMGMIIMTFPAFGLTNPTYYIGSLFYFYAFFATIAYFVYRKEYDYELLFTALISIITATFLFLQPNSNPAFVLGTGLLIFTLLTIVNKGYSTYVAKEKNDYVWIIRFIVVCLIAFLGLLTTINLYNELSVQTLMMGYYFITLGVMLILEPLLTYFVTPEKISRIMKAAMSDELELKVVKKEEPKKEVVKKAVTKKPTAKKVEVKTTTPKVATTKPVKKTASTKKRAASKTTKTVKTRTTKTSAKK